jgi:putative component of membrane protein insertase Oxa1/YidC/SpoIIIJ protein YidD
MKQLILFSVEIYWRLTSPTRRRPCLFRETCSQHVHRVTREEGAVKGVIAFGQRFRRCRLGYAVEFDGQTEPVLRLSDRSVAQTVALSESMAAFVEHSGLAVFGTDLNQPFARKSRRS